MTSLSFGTISLKANFSAKRRLHWKILAHCHVIPALRGNWYWYQILKMFTMRMQNYGCCKHNGEKTTTVKGTCKKNGSKPEITPLKHSSNLSTYTKRVHLMLTAHSLLCFFTDLQLLPAQTRKETLSPGNVHLRNSSCYVRDIILF